MLSHPEAINGSIRRRTAAVARKHEAYGLRLLYILYSRFGAHHYDVRISEPSCDILSDIKAVACA